MRASLHMVMSLLLSVDSRVIYVILLRHARRSPQAPVKGPSFLVVALLLRSARYRTGIGRTDRVGGHIILKLLDGIRGVHAKYTLGVADCPVYRAVGHALDVNLLRENGNGLTV
ncbi:hypothetical protein F5888DRAFT_1105816 [Russula emetica]|nr:hypothetical protein F5888DRAFT_1105816 [Russula emetica]